MELARVAAAADLEQVFEVEGIVSTCELLERLSVEEAAELLVRRRHRKPHGRVDHDGHLGDAPRLDEVVEEVEERLRAADGERRHEDLALARDRVLQDGLEIAFDVVVRMGVLTLAVGRLHHDDVDGGTAGPGPRFAVVQ